MSLMGAHLRPAVSARRVPLPLSFRQVQCSFSTTRLIRVVLGSPGSCAPVSEHQQYVRSTVYHFAQHELRELGSSWLCHVPHSHRLSLAELQLHPRPYKQGLASGTVGFQVDQYLTWLRQRLKTAGGAIERRQIKQVAELAGYGLVVNCSGIRGGKQLFKDAAVYPLREQITRLHAPWIKACHVVDDRFYVVPNVDNVILGGTQTTSWDCTPFLLFEDPQHGLKSLNVIHNYGHGISGVTLHWGCAGDVVALARQLLQAELPALASS